MPQASSVLQFPLPALHGAVIQGADGGSSVPYSLRMLESIRKSTDLQQGDRPLTVISGSLCNVPHPPSCCPQCHPTNPQRLLIPFGSSIPTVGTCPKLTPRHLSWTAAGITVAIPTRSCDSHLSMGVMMTGMAASPSAVVAHFRTGRGQRVREASRASEAAHRRLMVKPGMATEARLCHTKVSATATPTRRALLGS